ncbi:hypothetical protein Clacol_004107 [Clathrus columnatus]|uniref:Uncharacterized protein n=1 Tax=Clathrus columnatus TaxID=1419009 RepID=A0AAV5AB82_9AGAM|nr:hypothetical protein Clacol_004107 [Clathrus columnatus]
MTKTLFEYKLLNLKNLLLPYQALSQKAKEASSAAIAKMGVHNAADKAACVGFEALKNLSIFKFAATPGKMAPRL